MASTKNTRKAKQKLDAFYHQLNETLIQRLLETSNNEEIEQVLNELGPTLTTTKLVRSILESKLNHYNDFDADEYDDQEFSSPGPVSPTGLKINKNTPLGPGQPVLASQSGAWWLATVLSLEPKNKVLVHYDGWEDHFDEVVPRTRIQLREADDLDENDKEEQEAQPTRRRRR